MKRINHRLLLAGLVSLTTFFVYVPSLRNGFVTCDDGSYVYRNLFIRSINVKFAEWAIFNYSVSNWHPLTWLSHAVDYAVWGLNPFGHHLTSILLHSVNTLLAILLVMRLIESAGSEKLRPPSGPFSSDTGITIAALVTGLLFGLHPLHVESVAWIAERKDVLCAFFSLLSVSMYSQYAATRCGSPDRQHKFWARRFPKPYYWSLIFFILALSSKPMAVTLPMVLLILDWYPFQRISRGMPFWDVIIEKLPFIALSIFSSIITISAQSSGPAMALMETTPFWTRFIVAVNALFVYLSKMVVPINLIPFYPYPQDVSLLSPKYLLPFLSVIVITIICVITSRKKSRLGMAVWLYYVSVLIPVVGLIQVGNQSMADRYTYLPSLGPFLLSGLGAAWLYGKISILKGPRVATGILVAGVTVFIMVLSSMTVRQIGLWKNGIVLWNYVITKSPTEISFAYLNLGTTYHEQGQFDLAIENFSRAIALAPRWALAYNNRGIAYGKKGLLDKAIQDFDTAIFLDAKYAETYNNRGTTYGRQGLLDKAIEDFSTSISLNPNGDGAYGNLGYAYFLAGRFDKAVQNYNRAIELNRFNVSAYLNRANVYLKTGMRELALSDLRRGCSLGSQAACAELKTNPK
jgi:Tfp pilus assembly protein PilF